MDDERASEPKELETFLGVVMLVLWDGSKRMAACGERRVVLRTEICIYIFVVYEFLIQ